MIIRFKDNRHKDFYLSMQEKCKVWDVYHKSLFYCIGVSESASNNIEQLFDFQQNEIIPHGLDEAWQSNGSITACKLAFDLWNGFWEGLKINCCSPSSIFNCDDALWYLEGIKVRFPEYFAVNDYTVNDSDGNILVSCNSENIALEYKSALEKNGFTNLTIGKANEIVLDI